METPKITQCPCMFCGYVYFYPIEYEENSNFTKEFIFWEGQAICKYCLRKAINLLKAREKEIAQSKHI
jgi:hypothetical protein